MFTSDIGSSDSQWGSSTQTWNAGKKNAFLAKTCAAWLQFLGVYVQITVCLTQLEFKPYHMNK